MYKQSKTTMRSILLSLLIVVMLVVASCSGLSNPLAALPEVDGGTPGTVTSATGPNTLSLLQRDELYPSQDVLAALYDRVLPAVVDIEVVAAAPAVSQNMPSPFPFSLPQTPGPARGEGSGFVYDDDGHIVTNNHVIDNAEQITVHFYNGMWAEAELVAADPQSDLAVIKVDIPEGLDITPLPLAASNALDEGYWVVAFGTPFGLEGTMTVGIVSAIGRGMPVGDESGPRYTLPDVIQTDAAINPGNSGGPLLNLNGEVVGVNFAINSPVRANSGVGFAIPVGIVERIVPALIEDGAYQYPYLGISGGTITPQLADEEKVPDNVLGAWVGSVTKDGPADAAGIEEGDIIVAMDNTPIHGFDDLVSYLINNTEPAQDVVATVLRGEEEVDLTVTIGDRPTSDVGIGEGETETAIAIGEAIEIARETVESSGLIENIDSTSAELQRFGNQAAWEVTLSGDGKTATVTVDAATGEVVGLNVQ